MRVHPEQKVTGRGHGLVLRRVEGGQPRPRHGGPVPGSPVVVGVGVVLREGRVLVVREGHVLVVAGDVPAPRVVLRDPQVREGEHGVVRAALPGRVDE